MKYTSTRDAAVSVSAAQAVVDGISADGGLYVPEAIPKLDWRGLIGMSYAERADAVLRAYFDFDITGVAQAAYSTFETDDPAPTVKLDDDLFVLELFHGRTRAFKDMALSVLPRLIVAAKKSLGIGTQTLILVATSGDTGKAALEGFKDVEGTHVCVFYPTDGVSAVQKLAMQTQDGGNVTVVGIDGNFDDAQTAVKAAFADAELSARLKQKGVALSSANSINIGRLVPQITYYFSAYCDLVDGGEVKAGAAIDFVVPTGNFGNILAGWYAREMGLPINRLVCATNRNSVLHDFISTGIYDVNREFYKTTSPSMDILVSSNLERLLFEVSDRDAAAVRGFMQSLKATGRYEVSPKDIERIREVFSSGSADDGEVAEAIAYMFDEYGYLIDPHTAAAYRTAELREFVRPTVVVSTADPCKFAPAVMAALGERSGEASKNLLDEMSELTAINVPAALYEVFDKPIRFSDTVDKNGVIAFIEKNFG